MSKLDSQIQIIVADKGFVFIGHILETDGPEVVINNAQNLRRWGTTRGLGELVTGPTEKTEYDPWGIVMTVPIIRIAVPADSRWTKILSNPSA